MHARYGEWELNNVSGVWTLVASRSRKPCLRLTVWFKTFKPAVPKHTAAVADSLDKAKAGDVGREGGGGGDGDRGD